MAGAAAPVAATIWRTVTPLRSRGDRWRSRVTDVDGFATPIYPLFSIRATVPVSTIAAAVPLLPERDATIVPLFSIPLRLHRHR